MELVTVKELYRKTDDYLDKEVMIGGWVRSIRDSKAFGFIVVNDGSFFEPVQVVYHDTMENFKEISKLNVGAAILVKGILVATPQAKQPFEIQAEEITIEGASAPDYPLQKKRHTLEYLRTMTHLRPRDPIPSRRCSGYVPWQRTLFTSSFRRGGFCVCTHTADYRKRLRRCGRDVPGYNNGSVKSSEDGGWRPRLQQGFLP